MTKTGKEIGLEGQTNSMQDAKATRQVQRDRHIHL